MNDLTVSREQAIVREIASCTKAVRKGLDAALRIGELLTEVKASGVPFLKWVEQHCTFTVMSANRYMRAFEACKLNVTLSLQDLTITELAALAPSQRPAPAPAPAPAAKIKVEDMPRVHVKIDRSEDFVDQGGSVSSSSASDKLKERWDELFRPHSEVGLAFMKFCFSRAYHPDAGIVSKDGKLMSEINGFITILQADL